MLLPSYCEINILIIIIIIIIIIIGPPAQSL